MNKILLILLLPILLFGQYSEYKIFGDSTYYGTPDVIFAPDYAYYQLIDVPAGTYRLDSLGINYQAYQVATKTFQFTIYPATFGQALIDSTIQYSVAGVYTSTTFDIFPLVNRKEFTGSVQFSSGYDCSVTGMKRVRAAGGSNNFANAPLAFESYPPATSSQTSGFYSFSNNDIYIKVRKKLTTIYIDVNTGNDTNSGESGSPIASIDESDTREYYSGGAVEITAGTYNENWDITQPLTITASGTVFVIDQIDFNSTATTIDYYVYSGATTVLNDENVIITNTPVTDTDKGFKDGYNPGYKTGYSK